MTIETARLALVPVFRRGFADPHGILDNAADVVEMRRAQIAADPTSEPWLLRAIVFEELAIGTIGFHAPPDHRACVELGYEVHPAYRRRGIAREAAVALMIWAQSRGVRVFRASVAPHNAASLAMLSQLGFVRVGEHIDEMDGLELVFER